jgi:hypothetical protein
MDADSEGLAWEAKAGFDPKVGFDRGPSPSSIGKVTCASNLLSLTSAASVAIRRGLIQPGWGLQDTCSPTPARSQLSATVFDSNRVRCLAAQRQLLSAEAAGTASPVAAATAEVQKAGCITPSTAFTLPHTACVCDPGWPVPWLLGSNAEMSRGGTGRGSRTHSQTQPGWQGLHDAACRQHTTAARQLQQSLDMFPGCKAALESQ